MSDNIAGARAALKQAHDRYQHPTGGETVGQTGQFALTLANSHSLLAIAEELHIHNQLQAATKDPQTDAIFEELRQRSQARGARSPHAHPAACGKITDSGTGEQWCAQPIGHEGPCKLA